MIYEAMALLLDEFRYYLTDPVNGYTLNNAKDIVLMDNIALFESSTSGVNFDDKIIFTLVNIEEESVLKNSSFIKRDSAGSARYENPPVYLNLYLMITACNKSAGTTSSDESYGFALKRLSMVIRFFQSRNSFSIAGASGIESLDPAKVENRKLKITAELYTLTFEQVNHLWGTLGGKQMPFVVYKLRLVELKEPRVVREVPLIEEVGTNLTRIDI